MKEIEELKKELKNLKIKYEELRKRYVSQNDELCKLKDFISKEIKNENKHWNTKTRASRH